MTRIQMARGGAAILLAAGGLVWMRSLGSLQLPSVLAYSGLVTLLFGIVTVFLPARWSGFSRRIYGLLAGIAIGTALFAVAWFLPPRTIRVPAPSTRLDVLMPVYDFHERHELAVHAPAQRVRRALEEVSFADIPAMQTLGRIRAVAMGHFRTPPPAGVPVARPILEVVNDPRSNFFPLDDTPAEFVFGLAGEPWNNVGVRLKRDEFRSWAQPNAVKIAANFLIEDAGGGWSRIVTETRIAASDESARRKMAKYWALVYPGSGMVRRSLLEAVRVRAERP